MPSPRPELTDSLEALAETGSEPAVTDHYFATRDAGQFQDARLACLDEPERVLYLVSRLPRSRVAMQTLAGAYGVHRSTIWRRLGRIEAKLRAQRQPPEVRYCEAPDCVRPLPSTSTRRRRYCPRSSRCRVAAHRARRRAGGL